MKNLKIAVLCFAAVLALTAFSSSARADDYYAPYHPYTYGHDGYWDGHHAYHHWERYHDHDGYWDQRNGARIFIRL